MSNEGSSSEIADDPRYSVSSDSKPISRNLFRSYFKKIHRPVDLELIVSGIIRLLRNPIDAEKAYLPGSTKKISITSELLILLWELLTTSNKFLEYFCKSPKALDLVQVIIVHSLQGRNDLTKIGSLRLTCSMLHLLSQDRQFSVQLNAKFDQSAIGSLSKVLPAYTNGCYADFLFVSIYTILTTNTSTRPQILNLQESYLVTMANIAPMIKSFVAATATKLVALFNAFSSPAYLLSKKHNHRMLFHIVYIINTILQYQYSGNSQLVYCLVINREKINNLDQLDFQTAIETVNQVSADKKGKSPLHAYTSPSGFTPTFDWVLYYLIFHSFKVSNQFCPFWC